MGSILPGFHEHNNAEVDGLHLSKKQVVIYAVVHYILIGLYIFLLSLALTNIWNIIIR